MRRLIPSLLASAFLICAALPSQAQEEKTELADLVQVTEFTVAPGHAAKFEAGIHKYLEASKLAKIPEKYTFDVYQYDDRYVMVGFPENMAELDETEEDWVARFAGTTRDLRREAFVQGPKPAAFLRVRVPPAVPYCSFMAEHSSQVQ